MFLEAILPLQYYVQNSSIGIILVAAILFYVLGQGGKRQATDSLFVLLLLTTLALLFLEMFKHIFGGSTFAGSRTIHTVAVFFFLMCNPLIGYFYFLYIDQLQNRWWRIPFRMGILGSIPLLLIVFFSVLSLRNGMIFTIDATNSYSRGTYFFLVPLCNLIYLVGGQLHNILNMRKHGKGLSTILNVILPIPLILAAILQAQIEQVEILYLVVSLTLVTTYLYIQNNHANRDYLTSLYNRNVGEQTLSYMVQHKGGGAFTGGILMDLNGFKKANDQYGHDTGDRCLRHFAHLLTVSFSRNWLICRYGGDEFLLFSKIDSETSMEGEIAKFQKNLAHFNTEQRLPFLLSASIGTGVVGAIPPSNSADFLKSLDEAMYLSKRRHYLIPVESVANEEPS